MPPVSQQTPEATLRLGSHMIRRLWKYGLLFRFFGFFFIGGFHDRSLRRARVKFLSPYILCTTAWFLCGMGLEAAYLGSRTFLKSSSVRSYTKSLLFIYHSTVAVRTFFNILCLALGSSKLLDFFRESAAYEQSISYVPLVDAQSRRRKISGAARSILGLAVGVTCCAVATDTYLSHILGDYGEEWRLLMTIWAILAILSFFVYDSIMHIILTRTSDVLADYLHCQVIAFSSVLEKATHGQCGPEASLRVQEIRVHVSKIRRLVRFMNNIWHSALVASAGCLTFLLCVTCYALLNDGLEQRAVRVAFTYSLFCLYQFTDLVAVSQALVNEGQKLKNATKRVHLAKEGASQPLELEVQFLHDTIHPEAMTLRGGAFFSLNNALLVAMSASIITNTVILVQTRHKLEARLDVSQLAGARA